MPIENRQDYNISKDDDQFTIFTEIDKTYFCNVTIVYNKIYKDARVTFAFNITPSQRDIAFLEFFHAEMIRIKTDHKKFVVSETSRNLRMNFNGRITYTYQVFYWD